MTLMCLPNQNNIAKNHVHSIINGLFDYYYGCLIDFCIFIFMFFIYKQD